MLCDHKGMYNTALLLMTQGQSRVAAAIIAVVLLPPYSPQLELIHTALLLLLLIAVVNVATDASDIAAVVAATAAALVSVNVVPVLGQAKVGDVKCREADVLHA